MMKSLPRMLINSFSVLFVVYVASLSVASQAEAEKNVLRVYNWDSYIAEGLVQEFEKQSGAKVKYLTYDTNEELLTALLISEGAFDLVFPSAEWVSVLRNAGKLEKLDKRRIPNIWNLHASFRRMPHDPNEDHCLPYLWGAEGIAYNSKYVEDVDSWAVLWNEKYKGKIVLVDDLRDTIGAALIYAGYSVNTADPQELDEARKLLLKQKPLVAAYSAERAEDMLMSEDAWLSNLWGGDVIRLAEKKPELKYAFPKEGAAMFVDVMCIPYGAENKELAEDFMNFLLEPENGARLSNQLKYATPNREALKLVQLELLNNSFIYPGWGHVARMEFLQGLGGGGLERWSAIWKEIRK